MTVRVPGNYSGVLEHRRAGHISDEKWGIYLQDPEFAAWVADQPSPRPDPAAAKNPAREYPGARHLTPSEFEATEPQ